MSDDIRIPIVEEEAIVSKHSVDTERVSVRTSSEEQHVVICEEIRREHVEITRVAKDEEVAEAPSIRIEGGVTIVPVLEERMVVSKRLFLVEELHLRRAVDHQTVELPTTLRRTRVDVEREDLEEQERH
jgi:stress response protein YsnF